MCYTFRVSYTFTAYVTNVYYTFEVRLCWNPLALDNVPNLLLLTKEVECMVLDEVLGSLTYDQRAHRP